MTQEKPAPFVLVDGSSYLYRAFHAMPSLTTSDGRPTGAIRGVASMLRRLMADYQPTRIAVVFDAKGKTFRDDMYPEYKANRPPMPDDLRSQIEPLHELVQAMGFPIIVESGVEADDVIGTLAVESSKRGEAVLISTGDKDMAQLVDENVTLINTMTDTIMGPDGVVEKFGVRPDQIIDYLTLIGDTVDNVPGVNKVGPKTAVKWLDAYHTLDGVLENADAIKGKVGENLREAAERLPLSRDLVTIKLDVELDLADDSLDMKPADDAKLLEMFTDLGFRSWISDLQVEADGAEEAAPAAVEAVNYSAILTEEVFEAWIAKLEAAEVFAFDTETTDIDYMKAELVGMSFAVEAGEAVYLPVAHSYEDAPEQLSRDSVLARLKPLLENPEKKKLGHNLKYDMSVLANYDIELRGIEHDTMLESYVIDSTASRHNLDALCEKHLGHSNIHFEDVAGKGAKQITFDKVELEQATPYAAEDADLTLRLHQLFSPQLEQLERQRELYQNIEMPLLGVLSRIERTGVYVDPDDLHIQSSELAQRMQQLEGEAFDAAGKEFNLGSPKQLQEILFEEQGLPVVRKTPKGQPSTAEDVLQELSEEYDLPRLILEYRSVSKLKSTYTDKLPLQINRKTERIHTSYHQAVASTGRLSSSEPNLQNIPVRSAEGRKIRQAFKAPEGKTILAVDYSQIELRIMAHLSGDAGLLSAFAEGRDVHSATAAEVFSVELDAVTTDNRRAAKAINFGLIYGMSAFGLAKQLGVMRKEAQAYVDLYFERYPGVKQYMGETRELAKEQGYVETVYGRRLYLPEIKSRNVQRRNYAERTAINAPMQGTAADIIKMAMIDIDSWLQIEKPPVLMTMQVHDELVFEVETASTEAMAKEISRRMESVADLKVPLVAEAGSGANWDEAH